MLIAYNYRSVKRDLLLLDIFGIIFFIPGLDSLPIELNRMQLYLNWVHCVADIYVNNRRVLKCRVCVDNYKCIPMLMVL